METCSMGFEHESQETEVVVPVDPGTNENDVAIAEIEAAASVKREKIYSEQRDTELLAEVERQAGEIAGMREILNRIAPPEPDPADVPVSAPVVVAPAAAIDNGDPDEPAAPADVEKTTPKKSGGYWDGYSSS